MKYENRNPKNPSGKRDVPTKAELQQRAKKDNLEYYQNGSSWHRPR